MDLHIIFRGLCLFVPATNGKRVDVLFPETSGHPAHHVHHPLVSYRGLPQERKLLKRALHFRGGLGAGNGTLPSRLPHVLRAGDISGKRVKAFKLTDHPGPTVASRISLPAPDDIPPGRLVWFFRRVNGVPQCMELRHEITFIYHDVSAGALKPQTRKLGHPLETDDLEEPQPESGLLAVRVSHLPAPEHDPPICPGDEPTHTHLYYEFLEATNDQVFLDEDPGTGNCPPWEPRCGAPLPHHSMMIPRAYSLSMTKAAARSTACLRRRSPNKNCFSANQQPRSLIKAPGLSAYREMRASRPSLKETAQFISSPLRR